MLTLHTFNDCRGWTSFQFDFFAIQKIRLKTFDFGNFFFKVFGVLVKGDYWDERIKFIKLDAVTVKGLIITSVSKLLTVHS